jgi:hypothetical protein
MYCTQKDGNETITRVRLEVWGVRKERHRGGEKDAQGVLRKRPSLPRAAVQPSPLPPAMAMG